MQEHHLSLQQFHPKNHLNIFSKIECLCFKFTKSKVSIFSICFEIHGDAVHNAFISQNPVLIISFVFKISTSSLVHTILLSTKYPLSISFPAISSISSLLDPISCKVVPLGGNSATKK